MVKKKIYFFSFYTLIYDNAVSNTLKNYGRLRSFFFFHCTTDILMCKNKLSRNFNIEMELLKSFS